MTKTPKLAKPELAPAPRLLIIKDVAERLQVSDRTVYRLIDAKRLAVIRIGRSVRVSEEALKDLLTGDDTE